MQIAEQQQNGMGIIVEKSVSSRPWEGGNFLMKKKEQLVVVEGRRYRRRRRRGPGILIDCGAGRGGREVVGFWVGRRALLRLGVDWELGIGNFVRGSLGRRGQAWADFIILEQR